MWYLVSFLFCIWSNYGRRIDLQEMQQRCAPLWLLCSSVYYHRTHRECKNDREGDLWQVSFSAGKGLYVPVDDRCAVWNKNSLKWANTINSCSSQRVVVTLLPAVLADMISMEFRKFNHAVSEMKLSTCELSQKFLLDSEKGPKYGVFFEMLHHFTAQKLTISRFLEKAV